MKDFLEDFAEEFFKENGFLSRNFYDDAFLSKRVIYNIKQLMNMHKDSFSNEKIKEMYIVALSEFRTANITDISPSKSLVKHNLNQWLDLERIERTGWNKDRIVTYRARYFRYLEKIGRGKKYILETKRSSLKIIEQFGDPLSETDFYKKGLVVGSVQSGKTANFNAVINSAIDLGYSLIIVFSGITKDLRKQTQLRIEKDVVGEGINLETGRTEFKGVGVDYIFGEKGDKNVIQIDIPTSHKSDFKKNMREADFSLNKKNILVCKKNTGVLKNLNLWLNNHLNEGKTHHEIPILIIDDEADNASLNNMGYKGKEYASKINSYIRALLGQFKKKTYLGYTATPFANILQDRNDEPQTQVEIKTKVFGETVVKKFDLVDNLFPDDFIELLFPPSNYIGAKHFFETRIEDIKKIDPLLANPVSDHINSFPERVFIESGFPTVERDRQTTRAVIPDDPFPAFLPQSLKDAIDCFILSIAIKLSRKPLMIESAFFQPHDTMLIHISRFTIWQNRTKTLVEKYLKEICRKINSDTLSDPESIYEHLEKMWYKHYAYIVENIKSYLPDDYDDQFLVRKTFSEIRPLLLNAVENINVLAINSKTGDSLVYPKSVKKKYIAIGGNRLARGFTLEGLTINYFVRTTNYADTLLQMGRWFGYRPGYLDCCKLFTTANNIMKFNQTSVTIEALEQKFIMMNRPPAKTPSEFTLWVKSNPRVINITRAAFTRRDQIVERKVNYSGSIEQTTSFILKKERIENAWNDFKKHIKNKRWDTNNDNYLIHKTNSRGLFEFLKLKNSFADFSIPGIVEYIDLCNESNKLTNWTVVIRKNMKSNDKIFLSKEFSGLPEDIMLVVRRGPKKEKQPNARAMLLKHKIFKASGRSANIVTKGEDFSITLTNKEKENAEESFKRDQIERRGQSANEEKIKLSSSVPDKYYRSKMNEKDGVLNIYLISLEKVFESRKEEVDDELLAFAQENDLSLSTPLIGYAIGFPKVSGNIGGTYITRHEFEQPEFEEEFDESLNDED